MVRVKVKVKDCMLHRMVRVKVKIQVNQSRYRPGQVLRVPGGSGFQIPRQSTHGGCRVVSPKHRPPLPPVNNPDAHLC
jgi:hypothetical protein